MRYAKDEAIFTYNEYLNAFGGNVEQAKEMFEKQKQRYKSARVKEVLAHRGYEEDLYETERDEIREKKLSKREQSLLGHMSDEDMKFLKNMQKMQPEGNWTREKVLKSKLGENGFNSVINAVDDKVDETEEIYEEQDYQEQEVEEKGNSVDEMTDEELAEKENEELEEAQQRYNQELNRSDDNEEE